MPQAPPGLHRPPGTSGVARPLATPRGTQRPSGSRRYHVNSKPQIMTGWAAGPPEGFVTGNTSLDEWPIWWALNKILGPPGPEWLYQGRIGIGMLGSSKPDFVVFQDPPLVIRVQSDRYHLTVNGFRQAYDREQRVRSSAPATTSSTCSRSTTCTTRPTPRRSSSSCERPSPGGNAPTR
jgi:hypothetical protein